MNCKTSCRLCDKLVISQSVTIVTIAGVDTVVVDLPARAYNDGCKYCVIIAQAIPTTATIGSPVAFSIGGNTATVYPFVKCDCSQVTVCGIRTRTRYATVVSTNAIGGVFKSLGGLSCYPVNNLTSLPAPATATTPVAPAIASVMSSTPSKITKTTTTTKKEVVANE